VAVKELFNCTTTEQEGQKSWSALADDFPNSARVALFRPLSQEIALDQFLDNLNDQNPLDLRRV
jgi:hypothetical protein